MPCAGSRIKCGMTRWGWSPSPCFPHPVRDDGMVSHTGLEPSIAKGPRQRAIRHRHEPLIAVQPGGMIPPL